MKKEMNNKSHEFAFFSSEFTQAVIHKQDQCVVGDTALVHRIQHVVRAKPGETVMFFDDQVHAVGTVQEYQKNKVICTIGAVTQNVPILPKVTLILPLLKREALDEVVYACRELGVSQVYFVATDKSSRQSLSVAEYDRLERVSIAAAEQSKNFSPLVLHEKIVSLSEFLETYKKNFACSGALKLYADPAGESLFSLLNARMNSAQEFVLCVGPEGDMTDREKVLLQEDGFVFCKLGSTILRAQQAAILLAGIVRTLR
jgi:16S rRNA (uracil1498-N3)-methyltransferase